MSGAVPTFRHTPSWHGTTLKMETISGSSKLTLREDRNVFLRVSGPQVSKRKLSGF